MRMLLFVSGVVALAGLAVFTFSDNLGLSALAILSQTENECQVLLKEEYTDIVTKNFVYEEQDLNADGLNDIVVELRSKETCGTAGCLYDFCLNLDSGGVQYINFGFAAEYLEIQNTKTNGMRDIVVNGDKNIMLQWNGSQYNLSQ